MNYPDDIFFWSKQALFIVLLAATCLVIPSANGQFLHNGDNFQQIMKNSAIQYSITFDESLKLATNHPILQSFSSTYQNQTSIMTAVRARKYHILAKKASLNKKYKKAQRFYKKAIKQTPLNNELLSEQAQLYILMGKKTEAVEIYQTLLKLQPMDFSLHQQLAAYFFEQADFEKAKEHILLAHIYNRNEPSIMENMKDIFISKGFFYAPWHFEPNYQITTDSNNKEVDLAIQDSVWLAYATCKAVWKHEKNHVQTMQYISDNNPIDLIEEKECLFSFLVALDTVDFDYQAIAKGLEKAVELNQLDNFIFYEQTLRKNPERAFSLSPTELQTLMDYIWATHVTKMLTQARL